LIAEERIALFRSILRSQTETLEPFRYAFRQRSGQPLDFFIAGSRQDLKLRVTLILLCDV